MIDLYASTNGKKFQDLAALEAALGKKLTGKAKRQLTGWFMLSGGVIQLKGYRIYSDLESIKTDFKVRPKPSKPRLKDIKLTDITVRNINEHLDRCWHKNKRAKEQSVRRHCLSEKKQELARAIDSWRFDQKRRREELNKLRSALRLFRKDRVLVVKVDLRRYLPEVTVARESYGGIH